MSLRYRHVRRSAAVFALAVATHPTEAGVPTRTAAAQCAGETLPNGICLPSIWPPIEPHTDKFARPAYLDHAPDTIVLVGRQLFVDGA